MDAEVPAILPAFASSQCIGGTLVVDDLCHPIEVQLFYMDLRRNAVDRVAAFTAAQAQR